MSRCISTYAALKSLLRLFSRAALEHRSIIEDSSRRTFAELASKRHLGASNKNRNVCLVRRRRPDGLFDWQNGDRRSDAVVNDQEESFYTCGRVQRPLATAKNLAPDNIMWQRFILSSIKSLATPSIHKHRCYRLGPNTQAELCIAPPAHRFITASRSLAQTPICTIISICTTTGYVNTIELCHMVV